MHFLCLCYDIKMCASEIIMYSNLGLVKGCKVFSAQPDRCELCC
jgi:hypothetical protein